MHILSLISLIFVSQIFIPPMKYPSMPPSKFKTVKEIQSDSHNKTFAYSISTYDDTGKLKESFDSRDGCTYKAIYKYENTRQIESISYQNDTLIGSCITVVDEKGNVLEDIHKNDKNKVTMKIVSNFDPHGRCKNKVYYSGNGKIWRIENFKFDTRGNLIENTYVFENNKWIMSFYFYYDKTDKLIKRVYNRSDNGSQITELYYDNNNKLSKSHHTQYNKDVPQYVEISNYLYNKDGTLQKKIINNERGELQYTVSHVYEK